MPIVIRLSGVFSKTGIIEIGAVVVFTLNGCDDTSMGDVTPALEFSDDGKKLEVNSLVTVFIDSMLGNLLFFRLMESF